MNFRQKLGLKDKEEYEFSNEEREQLCAKLTLSMLDPKNHSLPAEIKDKALRANQEKCKLDKLFIHISAQAEYGHLNDLCRVKDIANNIRNQNGDQNPIEAMLIDQMTAVHKASMLMLSKIYDEGGFDLEDAERFIQLSNKLMKTYQLGLQTLNQIKNSGKQTIVVKHQNVQVNGGQAIVGTEINAPDLIGGGGGE